LKVNETRGEAAGEASLVAESNGKRIKVGRNKAENLA
jgi:hypothetical protein